jgi:hypothetical protein
MVLVAESPGSQGVLAFAQAAGLGPVVHDDQRVAQGGDLVFLFSGSIGAQRIDVRARAEPLTLISG